jgi:hypothetical protein
MARGVVSDRTSTFGFEPSPATSIFFIIFRGAMISRDRTRLHVAERLRELLNQIKLATLRKVKMKFKFEVFLFTSDALIQV